MYLPWVRYPKKIPQYEQTRFSGIERSKASGNGSIYDMRNISTDDYPILSAVPNRKITEGKYEPVWYYGCAEKEFVIAGKTAGGDSYPLWIQGGVYSIGDIAAWDGSLYEAVKNDGGDAEPSTSEKWRVYTGSTFSYDGEWSADKTYDINNVIYYGYTDESGNTVTGYYRNLTGESRSLANDTNWKGCDVENYKGSYKGSTDYYEGDIVLYSGKFYEHLLYGSGSDHHNPSNAKYWKLSDITIWNEAVVYAAGARVYSESDGNFYKHLSEGKSITPDADTINWEPYSYAALYYDGKAVEGLELIPGKKECAYLNGYIVILPDNMFYRVDDGSFGYLSGTKSGRIDTRNYSGIYYNGKKYSYPLRAGLTDGDADGNTGNGTMNRIVLGFFGGNTLMNAAEYSNIDLTRIFRADDVIEVNQIRQKAHDDYAIIVNGSYVVKKVEPNSLTFVTSSFAAADIGDNALLGGNDGYYYLGDIVLSKGLPEMDFLCVANNRMWGCREDTVFGSALGDVFSWQRYSGLESDPTYLESGDTGSFTGCCEYGGYPTFFKEHEMYRVYGSTFSTFSLQKVADYGLRKDSPHGVCTVDSILYFLSPNGVCAYAGGIPAVISDGLKRDLSEGCAGTDGKKLYLSVNDGRSRLMYVYDTKNRIWSSETLADMPLGIVNLSGELRFMDCQGNLVLLGNARSEWQNEADTEEAYIEFNDFYEESADFRHFGRVIVRASVEPEYDAIKVFVQYDSDGEWHEVGRIYNQDSRKRVTEFGFFPRKCDHYRIRLECRGKFTLYSVARQVE